MINIELDAICAEIMGWAVRKNETFYRENDKKVVLGVNFKYLFVSDWIPSTDIAQAKMVIDRLIDKHKMRVILVSHWNGSNWGCYMYPDPQSDKGKVLREDKTLERAMCLAAAEVWEKIKGGDAK